MRAALRTRCVTGAFALLAGTIAVAVAPAPASTLAVPTGFHEYTVFKGLTRPTAVEFSPDGRIFVAEKRGIVKVLDNLQDPTPKVFADLRGKVFNNWDRGLLGLALPPDFAADPWVYVLYTNNARIGGTAPLWPVTDPGNPDFDDCPTPPASTPGAAWSAAAWPGCGPGPRPGRTASPTAATGWPAASRS